MIGQGLSVGDIVLLIGDLGSGKTCLTQGLIKGLGSEDIARSPTFVIVAQYTAICPVYHMDLYRESPWEFSLWPIRRKKT